MNKYTDTTNQMVSQSTSPLLTVRDLKKHFTVTEGFFNNRTASVRAVDGVSFDVSAGETFGLVGESGSGKSTIGRLLVGKTEITDGFITFDGDDISSFTKHEWKAYRRRVQIVFQDASSSLNPRKTVKQIITEPFIIHNIGGKESRTKRVEELAELVSLPERYLYRYPHSLSGGQQQRVAIARALALEPDLLVLDEPTSSLDVSVQANIVNLLKDLQDRLGVAMVFISHNISLVKDIADRIGVMYLGKFMETAPSDQLFEHPEHPYTQSLLSAIPVVRSREKALKPNIAPPEGEIPSPVNPPSGCVFHTRCPKKEKICSAETPNEFHPRDDQSVWCHIVEEEYRSR